MSANAASLVAQVIVGLIIASAAGGYFALNTQHRALDAALAGGRNLTHTRRNLHNISVLTFSLNALVSCTALILCINAVIADRRVGGGATVFVKFAILTQLQTLMASPVIAYREKMLREAGSEVAPSKAFVRVSSGLLACFYIVGIIAFL
jgi:hypothetical protein